MTFPKDAEAHPERLAPRAEATAPSARFGRLFAVFLAVGLEHGRLGPSFLALLHQQNLGGDRCRPLDVDALVEAHVAFFLRAASPRS